LAGGGRDPGRRLTDARRAERAVELREAVTVHAPVVAQEFGGEWDTEDAGVVQGAKRPHLVALVVGGAGFALDRYLQVCSAQREQKFFFSIRVRGHMPWAAKVEPSVVRPDSGWQVAGPIHDYV